MLPEIGQQASLTHTFTDSEVRSFAAMVGDSNPVHLDESYAKTTRFGKRIAHGMLGASLISAVLGTRLPGTGSIYLNQTLKFCAPVFLGDTITAEVTVIGARPEKSLVTLETRCVKDDGTLVIEGEAVVLVESPRLP